MFSFHHGGLPNHFDNYFAEIASVHKYQRLASLQKYYLSRMKTSLVQLSLKQGLKHAARGPHVTRECLLCVPRCFMEFLNKQHFVTK